jgi:hypothetical protein
MIRPMIRRSQGVTLNSEVTRFYSAARCMLSLQTGHR